MVEATYSADKGLICSIIASKSEDAMEHMEDNIDNLYAFKCAGNEISALSDNTKRQLIHNMVNHEDDDGDDDDYDEDDEDDDDEDEDEGRPRRKRKEKRNSGGGPQTGHTVPLQTETNSLSSFLSQNQLTQQGGSPKTE